MKLFWIVLAIAFSAIGMSAASAQPMIERQGLGSGEPGVSGWEPSTAVGNDAFHAPQYMPGSPTAASIWPRVVEVPCNAGATQCEGYQNVPALGRGEYLFFRPAPTQAEVKVAPPVVITQEPRVIIREVEVVPKKNRE